MALKKVTFLFLVFVWNAFSYEPSFHDFRYNVDMVVTKDQNFVESFTDLISESAIVTDIKRLRIFSQQDKPISNMRALKDRITNDITVMYQKAHIYGFYGVDISYKIYIGDSKNVTVKMHVDLKKKFKLKLNVNYINQDEEFNKRHREILQKDLLGFKASVEEIKSFIKIAVNNLQRDGFFKPELIEKKVQIHHETHEAVLNLVINPGRKVFFSDVEIKSFSGIDDDFIKNRISWQKDEIFDIAKVESTTENLKNSQIFSKVKIKPNENAIQNDKIPMIIELQEDKKHTIDISLLYSGMRNMNFEKRSETQKRLKSIIARIAWINYNAFEGGEKLSFTIEGTPMRVKEKRTDYAFEVAMSQPDVFMKNNTADYSVSRRQELTNVFFRKSDEGSVIFNYPILDNFLVRIGGSVEKNYIDTNKVFFYSKDYDNRYDSFSIPLELIIDQTDNWLNPTSGYKMGIKFSEIFFKNSSINRLKTLDASFSYNYSLDDLKRTIFSFNVLRKSVLGQKIDNIPVDKRIYAGGMNSVRGYANQMATEMVVGENTPLGGKSSLEFNTEIRRRISEDFGAVVFFDGAKVFQNKSCYDHLKTEKKRWFYSVGIGIRYFTGIGPIRVDFAFPIKRRKGIDSKMQFIMSLGQAF
ncbi:MAG: BamA/TamA family outer membrane protein [Holosporaceae bacterium]|jgi:translocation and assembly module TamA|nr:BamA/TamA family outer membrane protein [Holosporaceae bacterium]